MVRSLVLADWPGTWPAFFPLLFIALFLFERNLPGKHVYKVYQISPWVMHKGIL